jgi:hypothetical protein
MSDCEDSAPYAFTGTVKEHAAVQAVGLGAAG